MGNRRACSATKRVVAVVERCANYIFHLMAVARAGFDSNYADTYGDTVRPDDLAFLRDNKGLFAFGGGSGGDLADLAIGLPINFNLDSKDAFVEYFDLLDSGCAGGDFRLFFQQYSAKIENLGKWWQEIDADAFRPFAEHRDMINRYGRIVTGNYDTYVSRVWDRERVKLEPVAARLNTFFSGVDRIGQWETITGTTFKFDVYHIILCSAIKNGPNANSVGYDRVVFYHDSPFDEITQFISHEIGTHILIDDLKHLNIMNVCEFPVLYEAFECLARYFNTLILNDTNLVYRLSRFHVAEYMDIYTRLHRDEPRMPPGELLHRGIKTFLATHS